MRKFNELTEEEKITRTKYMYLGIGFMLGMLTLMSYDLYLTTNKQ